MLEIKYVRKNLSKIQENLENRNDSADLETFKQSEEERRNILLSIEELRHKRNVVSDEIAGMKKAGENADDKILEMREVSAKIKELDKSLAENEAVVQKTIMSLPNMTHDSVPVGNSEEDNPVERVIGDLPSFDFEPKAHWDIGEDLNILDFERAAKISGARFSLYLGLGARLERALINFMIDIHTDEHGYKEVMPPLIVNKNAMTCTGQLPKFEEDLFKLDGLDSYLIPTAEVPITNIHQKEVLNEEDLPVKFVAFTGLAVDVK